MVKGETILTDVRNDITNEPIVQTLFEVKKTKGPLEVTLRSEDGKVQMVGDDRVGHMDSALEIQLTMLGSAHEDEILGEDNFVETTKQVTLEIFEEE